MRPNFPYGLIIIKYKNSCFAVIFPFVMGNNLCVIIYNPKFHSTFFFLRGAWGINAQVVDIHPVKIYGFLVKFSKNG